MAHVQIHEPPRIFREAIFSNIRAPGANALRPGLVLAAGAVFPPGPNTRRCHTLLVTDPQGPTIQELEFLTGAKGLLFGYLGG